MLISVFVGLVLISLFLIVLGYSVHESAYAILGFVFIFILSINLGAFASGNIYIQTGENITKTFSYNNDSLLINETQLNNYNYVNITEDSTVQWFARWIMLISAIGLFISMVELIPTLKGRYS